MNVSGQKTVAVHRISELSKENGRTAREVAAVLRIHADVRVGVDCGNGNCRVYPDARSRDDGNLTPLSSLCNGGADG
jgi:hypothetical protein